MCITKDWPFRDWCCFSFLMDPRSILQRQSCHCWSKCDIRHSILLPRPRKHRWTAEMPALEYSASFLTAESRKPAIFNSKNLCTVFDAASNYLLVFLYRPTSNTLGVNLPATSRPHARRCRFFLASVAIMSKYNQCAVAVCNRRSSVGVKQKNDLENSLH